VSEIELDFSIPKGLPSSLPVLALREGALLPGAVVPFNIGRKRSLAALDAVQGGIVLVGSPREPMSDPAPADLMPVATLARVLQRASGDGRGPQRVVLQGIVRVQITGWPASHPYLRATYEPLATVWPATVEAQALEREFRAAVEAAIEVIGNEEQVRAQLGRIPTFELLVDASAQYLPEAEEWRRDVLATLDPVARTEKVLVHVIRAREVVAAQKTIKERLDTETREMQKDFFLRQQLKAIQKELGEGGEGDDELERLRDKLDDAQLSDEARRVVDRETKRLERLGNGSPERSVALDWLGWIADLPWSVQSAVDADLSALEEALDRTHYGLDDVKRQVVEHLSVRKLAGKGRADVLLLVGPPGVGKTSIGQAIADATGRKLVRVALGGMRDEAELRGHRRTYIGARPGRLVEQIRRGGTADPVVLLDEIDKVGNSAWGNPSAALLEILDPEQNHAFVDHYIEVPFDLSKALFVATANDLENVPAALRDRMEVLRIEGYTPEEKRVIARNHLLEKVAENAGLEPGDVTFTDAALDAVITGWTREAGVRSLQRALGTVYRAAAVKKAKGDLSGPLVVDVGDLPTYLKRAKFHDHEHEAPSGPGLATGLAWTPVGGDVLYVEASTLPGKGSLVLTGQLGDVMKESARAALTYVLAHAEELGVRRDVMEGHDLHIHVPAGGVPKDGPSAGVTMFTALASLLSGRAMRGDTAMTGEATLRGRVLPVGGIKSKVLAAHRIGIRRVILPKRNEADLDDLPEAARSEMEFILVDHMSEVLEAALVPEARGIGLASVPAR